MPKVVPYLDKIREQKDWLIFQIHFHPIVELRLDLSQRSGVACLPEHPLFVQTLSEQQCKDILQRKFRQIQIFQRLKPHTYNTTFVYGFAMKYYSFNSHHDWFGRTPIFLTNIRQGSPKQLVFGMYTPFLYFVNHTPPTPLIDVWVSCWISIKKQSKSLYSTNIQYSDILIYSKLH